jgi:simple sugar transport system ATP-binding protein
MEVSQKLAHIPEDRAAFGSVPSLGISENLILKSFNRPPISTGWSINSASVRDNGTRLVEQYNISTPTIDTPARMLSGGNLQKVILARETSGHPNLIIAVHPTRGLDIGAIEGIHNLLIELRDQGTAILLISEELDELFSLADRIAVMYEGTIVGELPPERANLNSIGLMMAGTKVES